MCVLSCRVMSDSVTPRNVALQAPLPMQFSGQEYWNGLPFPPPWDLLDPEMEPASPVSPTMAYSFFTTGPPGKPILPSSSKYTGPVYLADHFSLSFLIMLSTII